jgi:hypothetical protein
MQAVTNKQNNEDQCQKVGSVQMKQSTSVKNFFKPNTFQKYWFKNNQSPGFGIEHNELLYIGLIYCTDKWISLNSTFKAIMLKVQYKVIVVNWYGSWWLHVSANITHCQAVAYPGIFFRGGSTNSVQDRGQRERGSGGGSPLVRGSGGGCNLVQEISFHIVKFS